VLERPTVEPSPSLRVLTSAPLPKNFVKKPEAWKKVCYLKMNAKSKEDIVAGSRSIDLQGFATPVPPTRSMIFWSVAFQRK